MPLATSYNTDYLKKLIKGIYDNTLKKKETFYDQFVNVLDTEDAYEIWDQDSGLGTYMLRDEGGGYTIDMPTKGGQKRLDLSNYGLGFAVTEKMQRFDKWDRAGKLAKQLAWKGLQSIDISVASILNNAFSIAYVGFEAGVALCSTAHKILRTAATWANTPATAVSIGLTAFQNAVVHFATLLDDTGSPSPMEVSQLITHPSNKIVVEEILKSQLVPYSAANTENIYKGLVTPLYNPYITTSTHYFFLAPKDDSLSGDGHSLMLMLNKKPALKQWEDEMTGSLYVVSDGYWQTGWLHGRGIYGDEGV